MINHRIKAGIIINPVADYSLDFKIYKDKVELTLAQIKTILRDIALGLAEVHSADIIYLDLKPANVLIKDFRAILADFGGAKLNVEESVYEVNRNSAFVKSEK